MSLRERWKRWKDRGKNRTGVFEDFGYIGDRGVTEKKGHESPAPAAVKPGPHAGRPVPLPDEEADRMLAALDLTAVPMPRKSKRERRREYLTRVLAPDRPSDSTARGRQENIQAHSEEAGTGHRIEPDGPALDTPGAGTPDSGRDSPDTSLPVETAGPSPLPDPGTVASAHEKAPDSPSDATAGQRQGNTQAPGEDAATGHTAGPDGHAQEQGTSLLPCDMSAEQPPELTIPVRPAGTVLTRTEQMRDATAAFLLLNFTLTLTEDGKVHCDAPEGFEEMERDRCIQYRGILRDFLKELPGERWNSATGAGWITVIAARWGEHVDSYRLQLARESLEAQGEDMGSP